MRLIMMGTGPFAAPTFRWLLQSTHEVTSLVTRPDKPVHGKRAGPLNPMREIAMQHRIPVLEPESINIGEARAELARQQPELLVVCDYGQILSPESLEVAPLGGINLHASLLPKYRGAAPINWAIYHGETETGVTVIHMTARLDAGPSLVQKRVGILPDDTAVEVEARLAELGVVAVREAIESLSAGGSPRGVSQDPTAATRAPRLKKTDGLVAWGRSAEAIRNQVRALQPWPKTYTTWCRDGETLRLILERVAAQAITEGSPPAIAAGTVVEAQGDRLLVACGAGILAIEQIQPAGRRVLSAEEFLRGYPLLPGTVLGTNP